MTSTSCAASGRRSRVEPSERAKSMFPHMANVIREAYVLLSEGD